MISDDMRKVCESMKVLLGTAEECLYKSGVAEIEKLGQKVNKAVKSGMTSTEFLPHCSHLSDMYKEVLENLGFEVNLNKSCFSGCDILEINWREGKKGKL